MLTRALYRTRITCLRRAPVHHYFGWVSLATPASPVLMTDFPVYATRARLTEKYLATRPGYDEYLSRTPFFVPTTRDRDYHDDIDAGS